MLYAFKNELYCYNFKGYIYTRHVRTYADNYVCNADIRNEENCMNVKSSERYDLRNKTEKKYF